MNPEVTLGAQDGVPTNTSSTYCTRVFARLMKKLKTLAGSHELGLRRSHIFKFGDSMTNFIFFPI